MRLLFLVAIAVASSSCFLHKKKTEPVQAAVAEIPKPADPAGPAKPEPPVPSHPAAPKTSVPRFVRVPISSTGAEIYIPKTPAGTNPEFELTYSEDSSGVYTTDVVVDSFHFAAVFIQLKQAAEKTDREELLIHYLDFLKGQFGITQYAGYGKGHTLNRCDSCIGVIDYWAAADETQYSVKGWMDEGKHMAVLILYGKGDYPYYNVQDMFLNGILFPGN
ncbi:MAG: hypothetical protein JNL57_09505 [Bacteroidetes bacterium]|nr:hypothetical protein [Bacteroidota bacterium]